LPIGFKQTISPPFIVAYMTESLDPQPTDKVLEIGTGSGYQAAVLSQIVAEVYTIEIVPELGKRAAQTLTDVGYRNVHAKVGDGYKGWPEFAPFDKIIVTCSPEDVPQPLIDQLKEGGRMIVPIGERYQQTFYLFEKRKGELVKTKLLPTMFVPMTGISEQQRKVLPDPTRPQILNGGFEIDEDQDGAADSWYYQRQLRRRIGGAPEGLAFIDFQCSEAGRGAQMLQAIGIEGSRVSGLEMSGKYSLSWRAVSIPL
jgi:protein-L-isoaspartate(D-aspartate) O-methyltransferase